MGPPRDLPRDKEKERHRRVVAHHDVGRKVRVEVAAVRAVEAVRGLRVLPQVHGRRRGAVVARRVVAGGAAAASLRVVVLTEVEEGQRLLEAAAVRDMPHRGLAGVPLAGMRACVPRLRREALHEDGHVDRDASIALLGGTILLVDVDGQTPAQKGGARGRAKFEDLWGVMRRDA